MDDGVGQLAQLVEIILQSMQSNELTCSNSFQCSDGDQISEGYSGVDTPC